MPQSFNAADYNAWSLKLLDAVSVATMSSRLSAGYITVGNRKVNPFRATTSVLLDNLAANEETITVTTLVNPFSQTNNPPTVISATFTKAHGTGCLVRSATFGLQEAVNDAFNVGGGLVIVDQNYMGDAGADAFTDIVGDDSVGILDIRDGLLQNYIWNGSAYVVNAAFADATYAGSASFQPVASDLTLEAAAGKNSPNSAFLAAIMGNLHGADLTKTGNILAGTIGEDSVTGTQATLFAKGGVIGIIADGVSASDGAVVALLDGDDGGTTTPFAMFKAIKLNSTSGNNPQYGLDLLSAVSGFLALVPTKADIRMADDVCILHGSGAPTDGVTGANFAGPGSEYIRTGTGDHYFNTNTKASPSWKLVTHA